jgi:hypothetical protein
MEDSCHVQGPEYDLQHRKSGVGGGVLFTETKKR